MSIISLILSTLSLLLTAIINGYPFLCKYVKKNTKVYLVVTDSIVQEGNLSISLVYINHRWQSTVVANSSIRLFNNTISEFQNCNRQYSCSLSPLLLRENEQAVMKLQYPMPDLSHYKKWMIEETRVNLNTKYIDNHACLREDQYMVGTLKVADNGTFYLCISHKKHLLQGHSCLISARI